MSAKDGDTVVVVGVRVGVAAREGMALEGGCCLLLWVLLVVS
jgi:hypothetical protein